MEVETKPTQEQDAFEEIKHLRQKLQKTKDPQQTVETIQGLIEKACLQTPLTKEQVESLTDAVYPLLKGLDLTDQTLIFEIPIDGTIQDSLLQRYCIYVDYLKQMGAKSVVFVGKGIKLESLNDRELEKYGLRRI